MCLNAVLSTICINAHRRLLYCSAIRRERTLRPRKRGREKTEPKLKFVRNALQCIYIMISFSLHSQFLFSFFLPNAGTAMAEQYAHTILISLSMLPYDRNFAIRPRNEKAIERKKIVTHAHNFYDFAVLKRSLVLASACPHFALSFCWCVKIKYEFVCSMPSSKWE